MILRLLFSLKTAIFQILKTVQDQDLKNGLKISLKIKTGLKDYITG